MDAKQNGEQAAFARAETPAYNGQKGCTKRELAAMTAMQGILSKTGLKAVEQYGISPELVAALSVQSADALLAELAKEVKP